MPCYYRIDDDKISIKCPCSEFHAAVLQVEGEVKHNDLAVALKDGWRVPGDHSCIFEQNFGLMHDGKVTVSTMEVQKE